MQLRVESLIAMVVGVGCVMGESIEPRATDGLAAVQQAVLTCDEFMCGTNSPQIGAYGFWDLNLPPAIGVPGLPNNVGLQVTGFFQGVDQYLPKVYAGRLTATRTSPVPPYDTITLTGAALVGGWLELSDGKRRFKLTVNEVGTVDSWAQPVGGTPHVTLESYRLDWAELLAGGWDRDQNVCIHPPSRDSPDAAGWLGSSLFHTLLFEGDRIDAAKKLDTAVDATWFNLGCAGSALAKMALTGHSEGSLDANTFTTTLSERQTMLKMLTADYCGTGTAFTVAGQPLNWRDDRGTMQLLALAATPPQPLVLEARWTEKGAACLDKRRVDVHWTELGDHLFGSDVYAQVARHCRSRMPPPCADASFDPAGYHLLTATVPFQP